MAQSIFIVTSTVETGVATSRELESNSETRSSQTAKTAAAPKQKVSPSHPDSVVAKERWSTDSKEKWSTSPVKKQHTPGQVNGHNAATKVSAVNQTVNKTAAKTSVSKNRRESPVTKSRERSLLKSIDSKSPLSKQSDIQSPLSGVKATPSPTLTGSRPKRVVRSLVDRNPDFHIDISVRGEASETDSLDGVAYTPVSERIVKEQMFVNNVESFKPVETEALADIPVNKAPTLPFLSESRPKRSGGRSLFERNPDFALDIPFAKIVEQNWKAKNQKQSISSTSEPVQAIVGKKAKLSQKENVEVEDSKSKNISIPNKKREIQTEKLVTVKTEVEDTKGEVEVAEVWKSDVFRAEHLAKLDNALSTAGWSQAIRSGKNMEKEVFKNSKSEPEYVAGINRLVAHFNRGNTAIKTTVAKEASIEHSIGNQSPVQQHPLNSGKIIKPGNEKLKTSISKMQVSAQSSEILPITALKEKRVVKPTKKIIEKKANAERLKGVKKVTKTWSRTKVNCPMCGQPQLKTKLKEHMLVFHKSSPQFPCVDCEFKSSTKVDLENHLQTVHQDLNREESVSESEGSVSSQSISSSGEARSRANAVRSQFQYVVKTSKSGKQGRKYIEVDPGQVEGDESIKEVPDVCSEELNSTTGQKPKLKKKPVARKVITPGTKITDTKKLKTVEKNTASVEEKRQNEVMKYMNMKEDDKSRQHEVLHEAAVSEKVVDEFAGSSSESEFSEPQNQIVGTLNAYYMNKPNQEEDDDVTNLQIDSVTSVPPSVTLKERPQRRKRSLEDRNPDFILDIPKSAQKSDSNSVKKGKKENEESEVTNVAKNWFEVNEGEEF
eukprot:GFUD01021110.1.p1 GENE.GFUD01021110.1~~GFUD01021110.1.p1  ORF type:complete len:940 (-),score=282.59 GFUD01021110.1:94-2592(-)